MRSEQQLQRRDLEIDDRLLDIARIFAEGVLRLHKLGHLPFGPNGLSVETALKSARQDLEQSRVPRLTVSLRLTAQRHND